MKILLTTIYAYPPKGGLGKYIQELKTGLERSGHEVEILARDRNEYYITKSNRQYPIKKKNKKSIRSGVSFPSQAVGKYLKNIQDEANKYFEAVRLIDLSQYQVIHAQDIISASVLNFYKPISTPLIITVHGCVTAEYYYYGYIKPRTVGWNLLSSFETQVLQQSSKTIVPSEWLLGVYKQCKIPTGNMQVITNGIDVQSFENQMNRETGMKKPSDKTVIICTGRLVKVKGQHILLDSLARLKRRRSEWVCWVVGKGDNEKALKEKSKKLGLSNSVQFLERRDDVPALLNQADIFVIPSLQENYPYSLVEAHVAGKAVIGSQVGGITEMIEHMKNGILVPPGDSRALYRQIRKLLDRPQMRSNLSSESRRFGLERFSLATMTERVLDVYNTALNSRKR